MTPYRWLLVGAVVLGVLIPFCLPGPDELHAQTRRPELIYPGVTEIPSVRVVERGTVCLYITPAGGIWGATKASLGGYCP